MLRIITRPEITFSGYSLYSEPSAWILRRVFLAIYTASAATQTKCFRGMFVGQGRDYVSHECETG